MCTQDVTHMCACVSLCACVCADTQSPLISYTPEKAECTCVHTRRDARVCMSVCVCVCNSICAWKEASKADMPGLHQHTQIA